MGRMSRTKGASAEREICRLLSEELGFVVERNVDQARRGGADCIQIPGFSLEVKRHERLSRPAWWAQAVEQGAKAKAEPLVAYRRSREPWRFLRVDKYPDTYRDVSWVEAMEYVREKLSMCMGVYPKEAA